MPLGGAKDEHCSCFHSSCQLGLINKITTYTRHLNLRPWANGFSRDNTTNYEIYEYISSIENSCQLFDWIQMHILNLESELNQPYARKMPIFSTLGHF